MRSAARAPTYELKPSSAVRHRDAADLPAVPDDPGDPDDGLRTEPPGIRRRRSGGKPGLTPPQPPRRLRALRHRSHRRARASHPASAVEQAIAEARKSGRTPEQVLLAEGGITTDQLARATAERFGLDHVDLSVFDLDLGAVNLIPTRRPSATARSRSHSSRTTR